MGPGRFFGFFTRVLGDEASDGFGFFTDDDVLGHDRPRETAVLDREERIVVGLGSLVEVRTLRAQTSIAGPLGAGRVQGVATGAVRGEEDGPFVFGVALGNRYALLAEATGNEPESRGGGQSCG